MTANAAFTLDDPNNPTKLLRSHSGEEADRIGQEDLRSSTLLVVPIVTATIAIASINSNTRWKRLAAVEATRVISHRLSLLYI